MTFRKSCVYRPAFLRLMLVRLHSLGFAVPAECWDADYALYNGDQVTVGRGEILIRET